MEADFSGYATKAGLKCSDGRTIMPDAFKHQDKIKVPLVWQHGHTDPENVLGHVLLENREDGVYAYGFFNETGKAKHARNLVEHGDINMLSIWANDLIERSKKVLHGAIREVSLVLSGANPGAIIENVTIRHSDDDVTELEDEAIIYTGLVLEHSSSVKIDEPELVHAEEDDDDDETIQDVYESMNEKQKQVLHFMIGEALESASGGEVKQSAIDLDDDSTIKDVYDSMTEAQKNVLHYMIGEALEPSDEATHSNTDDSDSKGNQMKHNVFEQGSGEDKTEKYVLSHSEIETLVSDATKTGSMKQAVENFALAHGIQDIDVLFPEARAIGNTPEFFARRTEWVQNILGGVRKSPFSRIKTVSADITVAEARAKGYITGTLKKEEFFKVKSRTTTPQTVYKKQKLDRDDMVDITDFDVVAWLKGEMRLMLDEEIARAILVGDGRAVDDEDKINEENVRPVANDHELYTTSVNVNIDDANSNMSEVLDAIVMNRGKLRGTGLPTLYTTESYISRFMLLRDGMQRRMYRNVDEIAAELRVKEIVAVEVLEEHDDIVAILFNPSDYVVGADRGGEVSMFDDFDIDYNQYKYLIETRISGALVKLKAALVVRKVASTDVLVAPAEPTFDGDAITIVDTAGVTYRNADTDAIMTAAGSPYAVADGETVRVTAEPNAGYYFSTSDDDEWAFTGDVG